MKDRRGSIACWRCAARELSRSRLKALILAGQVRCRTAKATTIRDPAYHVAAGDTITVDVPPAAPAEPAGEDIPLDIVFEDDDIIVIDKPNGLVVHPAAGHETGTLVNALIAHCGASLSGIGGVRRPGIVHRLDKDTTGLMVVAKNDARPRIADRAVRRPRPHRRRCGAATWPSPGACPTGRRGTIDAPIDRHPHAREKMAVRDGGREAITHWEVLETLSTAGTASRSPRLLACQLETGRTHQIRVHLRPSRPSAAGRRRLRPGFKTKAVRSAAAARRRWPTLAGRRCTPISRLRAPADRRDSGVRISELPADLARLRVRLRGVANDAG